MKLIFAFFAIAYHDYDAMENCFPGKIVVCDRYNNNLVRINSLKDFFKLDNFLVLIVLWWK